MRVWLIETCESYAVPLLDAVATTEDKALELGAEVARRHGLHDVQREAYPLGPGWRLKDHRSGRWIDVHPITADALIE